MKAILPDTGSASRRLLNSRAQLPKSSEAWHAGKASPWGQLAVPVSYRSEFPALLLFGFHTLLPRKHTQRHKDQKLESGPTSSPGSASTGVPAGQPLLHHLPPWIPCLKSALLRPQSGDLVVLTSRFKVIFQSFGDMGIHPGKEKVSHQHSQEDGKWTRLKQRTL